MKTIEIIVPCYNEEKMIKIFYNETKKVLDKTDLKYSFIFVDDGSKDNTLTEIKKLIKNGNISYISFSRNFGKEAAIYAGLKKSNSDYVVIIDADLQHDPSKILLMYQLIKTENYDYVITRRINREGESSFRSFLSNTFYRVFNMFSNTSMVYGLQDYCMLNKIVVEAILSMSEYNRFTKGIYGWIGFNRRVIDVENNKRIAGQSSWNFYSLFKYATEGITSFTSMPLKFATIMGMITALLSIVYMIYVIFKTIIYGETVQGYPTLVILILFLSSIQLLSLGIIGEYISKIYLETKKRPIYLVREEK